MNKKHDLKRVVILIDQLNMFIGGKRASASRLNLRWAGGSPEDQAFRLDYTGLISHLADDRVIQHALLVGSRSPSLDSAPTAPEEAWFTAITHKRDRSNKEKAVDTEIVARGVEFTLSNPAATLVIASGDRNVLPLVTTAQRYGWYVEIAAFFPTCSSELRGAADRVRYLDGALDRIGYRQTKVVLS